MATSTSSGPTSGARGVIGSSSASRSSQSERLRYSSDPPPSSSGPIASPFGTRAPLHHGSATVPSGRPHICGQRVATPGPEGPGSGVAGQLGGEVGQLGGERLGALQGDVVDGVLEPDHAGV